MKTKARKALEHYYGYRNELLRARDEGRILTHEYTDKLSDARMKLYSLDNTASMARSLAGELIAKRTILSRETFMPPRASIDARRTLNLALSAREDDNHRNHQERFAYAVLELLESIPEAELKPGQ
jgi:hypothetical protein